jgi:excinuclease ABC subunit A
MSPKGKYQAKISGEKIVIRGARTHNLKNIDLEIPRNKMVVFTGLSGSGKSSLAFDTIFAEGQRRYVESLSPYARQFLNQLQKPDVDEISGLSPAIAIDQKTRSNNPRSTVATITEIYDYLRVLYARVGKPHCIECGTLIRKMSNEEIINIVEEKIREKRRGLTPGASTTKEASSPKERGVVQVKGVVIDYNNVEILSPVVRGRKGEYYQMLYDMLSKGYTESYVDGDKHNLREKIVLDKNKKHNISVLVDSIGVDEILKKGKDAKTRLSEAIEHAIHESSGLVEFNLYGESTVMSTQFACSNCGFSFPEVEPRLFSFNSPYGACPTCNGLGVKYIGALDDCEDCGGKRLRKEALNVFLMNENDKKNIVEITNLSIEDAKKFFDGLHLTDKEMEIAKVVLKEISTRLVFLLDVGLNYLNLNRKADTLSGGEAQRIRLASQLGSQLVGALYVLDEPTIGLHQRDNEKLINTLIKLRDLGNTILVVEHDEDTAFASDFLVDIGPGAGVHGGHVVVADYLDKLLTAPTNKSNSITLSYLREEEKVWVPKVRRDKNGGELTIKNGNIFNIANLNIKVPLQKFVCITGVSGSGKSTLMYEIINRNLEAKLEKKMRTVKTYNCDFFGGVEENLSRVILIDQSPIGRTPRSNPATYTGIWTPIRELLAESVEARVRGWSPSRFSFNVPGGRCETCQGNGEIAVEMHFLPTVYVQCDVCNGKRFMKETLEVKFKNKNVYEILEMTVEEAEKFFFDIPSIHDRLDTLMQVGLGYLKLGQSATTLSGGEAQRVKISSELYRPHTEKTIYLLDEPTVGLHFEDVRKLIDILNRLVDKGNSLVVIEHNLDVIKCADWIIDVGPEGGVGGGKVVAQGSPEHVATIDTSHTGRYLKKVLKRDKMKYEYRMEKL